MYKNNCEISPQLLNFYDSTLYRIECVYFIFCLIMRQRFTSYIYKLNFNEEPPTWIQLCLSAV